jgi:medium-chain acyl-[acyl-carrier-protein] hydrolase
LQDKEVTRDQLEAWSEQTLSEFKLRMVEGDHFFINTTQAILLQFIAQDLHQLTLV